MIKIKYAIQDTILCPLIAQVIQKEKYFDERNDLCQLQELLITELTFDKKKFYFTSI